MSNQDIEKLREAVRNYVENFEKLQSVLPESLTKGQLSSLSKKFRQLRKEAERL